MRLTNEELSQLIVALDSFGQPCSDYEEYEKDTADLCIKLSKELDKRGISNMVSVHWLRESVKNDKRRKVNER